MKKRKLAGILMALTMAVTPLSQAMPFIDTPVYAASEKLAAPKGFKADKVLQTSITLKWNKVKGAGAYRVLKYDASKKKYVTYRQISGTSCKVTGLKASTKYKFKVCALVKTNGKYKAQTSTSPLSVKTKAAPSSETTTVTKTTTNEPVIRSSSSTYNSVTLKYKKVKDAVQYNILKYNEAMRTYYLCKMSRLDEVTIYDLEPDTEYKFKVVAMKNGRFQLEEISTSDEITIRTQTAPVVKDPYEGYDTIDDHLYSALSPEGLGTAGHLVGSTAVVSVFVDDKNTKWDLKGQDEKTCERIWQNTQTCFQWIADWARQYGRPATIYYDFRENPDLLVQATIDADLTNADQIYEAVGRVLNKNVDSQALKVKYGVSNLVYMIYVNSSDEKYDSRAWAFEERGEKHKYPYEFVLIYKYQFYAAVMAHHVLHLFGAPYTYKVGQYGITQEFVDYLKFIEGEIDEIMFRYKDAKIDVYSDYDITNSFSRLTAYYLGLSDWSEVRNKWGLGKSQHVDPDAPDVIDPGLGNAVEQH